MLWEQGGGGSSALGLFNGGVVTYGIVLGGGIWTANFYINLQTLSTPGTRYVGYIGMIDQIQNQAAPNNGVYFKYSDNLNGGNWQCVCTSSSVSTTADSGIAASSAFIDLGVTVDAAAANVSFSINGSNVATITTNIPSANIAHGITFTGFVTNCLVDLFYSKFQSTNIR